MTFRISPKSHCCLATVQKTPGALLGIFFQIRIFAQSLPLTKQASMYYISKRIEIAGSHRLNLNYESKCSNLHGHNWVVTINCKSQELDENGMVCDFSHIKERIHNYLDHGNFNELLPFNPTAENIAKWICDQIPQCYKVSVQESEGNTATYVKDE